MNKKSFGHLLLISLVFLGAFGLFSSLGDQALAQPKTGPQDGELSGWAWSSNIGWISFNSNNTGSAIPYSVTIDPETKVLSGYAWSSSLGWLRFGSGLDGPIEGGDNWPAKIDGDKLTGWARFCSVYVDGCSGETKPINGSELGSWDGWLKMENVTYNRDLGRFEGFSWGSLNVGWVNFLATLNDLPSGCTPVNTVDTNCDGVDDCSINCGGNCVISCGGGGPSVTCSVEPSSGPIGSQFVWFVSGLSGFTGDDRLFDYDWNGSDGLSGVGSWVDGRNQIEKIYSTSGQKTANVTVTNGSQTASANCTNDTGGDGVNVCVEDDVVPDPGETCCNTCPTGQTDSDPYACGCQGDDLLGCQIEVINDAWITYSQDASFRFQDKIVKMKIINCNASNLKLISENLNDEFYIVCSSSLDGPYSTGACENLSSSLPSLFVWVSPQSILPLAPITKNIFQLKLEGIDDSKKEARFDYLVGGGT